MKCTLLNHYKWPPTHNKSQYTTTKMTLNVMGVSWHTQRHICVSTRLESAYFCACCTCKLCVWRVRAFFFPLSQFHTFPHAISFYFISFLFSSFAIAFTFVNVVLYIHWFGYSRSHRFNRCVRPSICPELIVSQTVSIEFNLVSKIHRMQRNEWEERAREQRKLNTEWREEKTTRA